MLRVLLWCSLPALALPAGATAGPVPAPQVILYTIGQGDDVFEKFGHTALCLRHPVRTWDVMCFDYGTADFDDFAGLAWNFIRGSDSFGLSMSPESEVFSDYEKSDRSIWRQVLPLTPAQAEAVRLKLFADAQDPRWRYGYRLFDDNCATRVRDILDMALGGRLRAATAGRFFEGRTLRDYGRRGFAEVPVALLLTDLLLGRHADREADLWAGMALPAQLRDELRNILGVVPELVHQRSGRAFSPDPGWGGRGWFFLLALALATPLAITTRLRRGREYAIAGAVLPLVLLGMLVWLVAIVSPMPEGRVNEVLLVFVPYDVILPFLNEATRRQYARVRIALLAAVSLFLALGVFIQPLWAPILVVFAPMAVLAFLPVREAPPQEVPAPAPDSDSKG
jgi:hypothetical protein